MLRFLFSMFFIIWLISRLGTSAETPSQNNFPTLGEMQSYPLDCKKKDQQLAQLNSIKTKLNYSEDIDSLSEFDRDYNSILKANIWWFVYSCEQ